MKTNKLFDLREEVDIEVHKLKPSWWMRYGILSAFLILLVVLFLGYLIKYPDIVPAEFRLLSSEPSITIPLPQNSQVDRIFTKDGEQLKKGAHILLFKNSTDYNDLIYLDALLQNELINSHGFNALFERVKDKTFDLGELQGLWTQLFGKLLEHYTITKLLKYDARVKRLNLELDKQHQLNAELKSLLLMNNKEKTILKEFSKIDSTLYSEKVLSKADYLSRNGEHIVKSRDQKQHEIAAQRNDLEIVGLLNAIENTKEEKRDNLLAVRFHITEAISKLKSEIKIWKKNYLIETPIDGTLNLLGNIGEKKYIISEEHSIVITPQEQGFKAIIKIPFTRAGKVEKGQRVHLKLSDYPYQEYGYLEGDLSTISNVAGAEYYYAQINLGSLLRTNYNKVIRIKENMSGYAEIITEDRSILSRVLDKFLYIFRK